MRRPPRLMPAMITPFTPDGEIDPEAYGSNVAILSGRGVEGFLVAGSTGEGPYLDAGERRSLVEASREAVPDTYLMCGVAGESLRTALAQTSEAADGGADSVLVLTPTSLVRGNDDLVAGFYEEIADRSPLPVFLYSVPRVTGYELPTGVAAGLNAHPSVAGMKDSGGQPVRVPALLAGSPDRFDVYSGSTPALALAVAAGARGGITASSNYAAGRASAVVEAAASSPGSALTLQDGLTRLSAAVEQHGIPGVKAAASLIGLEAGELRRPLMPVSAPVIEAIRSALEAAAII